MSCIRFSGSSTHIAVKLFYSSRPRASRIAEFLATLNCSSDEDDCLSDDDDVVDPDFEPVVDKLIENGEIDMESDNDEQEITDLDEQLTGQTTSTPRRVQKNRILWQSNGSQPPIPIPTYNKIPDNYCSDFETPYEYFKKFITDELIQEIRLQTNLYASRKNPNQPLNIKP